jgi:DNA or RNA helicases of superfamily II
MKILVRHTHIEISPYKKGDDKNLEKDLEIKDPITRQVNFTCYHVDNDTLYLPRSYNIRALEKTFHCPATIDRTHDETDKIIFKLLCDPRDKFQYKAMNFLACKDEFESLANSSRFNLELGTGIGKTYCAIAAAWYYKVRPLVIMHLDTLIQQWKARIKKYTNIVENEIYVISGKDSIDKLYEEGVCRYKFILASHGTLRSYAKTEGYQKLDELIKFMKVGIKIYDEAHLEFANIMNIDFHSNVSKNFYLTATAKRSDYKQNMLYQRVLGSAPSLSLKLDKKDRNVVSCVLKFDSNPSQLEISALNTMRGLHPAKYLRFLFNNKKSKIGMEKTFKIAMNTLKDIDGQIAILVGLKEIIPLARKFIEDNYPELKNDIGELHSNIKKKDKPEQLKKKIIITTYKSFGTGTDLTEMLGIINFESYSSEVTATQLIGRLRNKGYYMEIFNKGILKRLRQFDRAKPHIASSSKKVIIHDI